MLQTGSCRRLFARAPQQMGMNRQSAWERSYMSIYYSIYLVITLSSSMFVWNRTFKARLACTCASVYFWLPAAYRRCWITPRERSSWEISELSSASKLQRIQKTRHAHVWPQGGKSNTINMYNGWWEYRIILAATACCTNTGSEPDGCFTSDSGGHAKIIWWI